MDQQRQLKKSQAKKQKLLCSYNGHVSHDEAMFHLYARLQELGLNNVQDMIGWMRDNNVIDGNVAAQEHTYMTFYNVLGYQMGLVPFQKFMVIMTNLAAKGLVTLPRACSNDCWVAR